MNAQTGTRAWWNGRVAVAVTSLIGFSYLLLLVLPYVQLETKAQALICRMGLPQACSLSVGIVASRVTSVLFQYVFLALPGLVLAVRGHRRSFALPLLVPAVGAVFLAGLRSWVFAFALPTASWLGLMERASATWHWQAPVWESHWAIASLIGLVLAALPAALVASRHRSASRTTASLLGERTVAVGAASLLAAASLAAISLMKPEAWPTAQIPEAFIVGLFVFAVVLRDSVRTSVVVTSVLGFLAWADLALFNLLRLGVPAFGSSGLLQVLPTLVLSFAAIGLAGSLRGPMELRLRSRREALKALPADGGGRGKITI